MPLAGHQCCVVVALQRFRYGDATAVQVALVGGGSPLPPVAARGLGHVPDPDLVGMEPGHQGSPRWTTPSAVVELGKAHAPLGEGIEVRGIDLSAMVTKVGKAHVVDHDEDDVGPLGGVKPAGKPEKGEREYACEVIHKGRPVSLGFGLCVASCPRRLSGF